MAPVGFNREPDPMFDAPAMSVNPLTLKFSGDLEKIEPDFLIAYGEKSVKYLRAALILGIILYSAFGFLDDLLIQEKEIVEMLWFIRYAVVCPTLAIVLILSFRPFFSKFAQVATTFVLIVSGSGISIMVALAPSPANFSYYAGVMLVLMFGYGFSKLRFMWASFSGWVNLFVYEAIAIMIVQTPEPILINNNFFFIGANIIGMCTSYAMEHFTRKDFLMAQMLELEQKKVTRLNLDLEHKVIERTAEIRKINTDLQKEIQARNQAEEKRIKLEYELYQSQKMESIGNLAGGIAHDFNNILYSIMGYTELSLDDVEKGSIIEDNLKEIHTAGVRARELIKQILAFARKSDEKVQEIEPAEIIREVLKFLRSTIPTTIEIKHKINSTSRITGNPTQVHQILMNLCTNSAHAMKENGGLLDVQLEDVTVEKEVSGNSPGKYVELTVADNGTGIPPEIIESIFEPYFTTKQTGEGTGMGLAMIHGIVESYKGFITVDSKPGKGSVFKIYLPVSPEEKNGSELPERLSDQ